MMPKKKTKIPPQRDSVEEAYTGFTVALEDLHSKFDVFGENLLSLIERVTILERLMDQQSEDMRFAKEELHMIRYELKQKASLSDLQALDIRVTSLERKIVARL